MKERVRLMRDGVVNYSGFVSNGLAGIILVPVMLRFLGTESYGLWLAALATHALVGAFDFGLHWSITREVSAAQGNELGGETIEFVRAAGNLYWVLGMAGALLIVAMGFPVSSGLHLSTGDRRIAPEIFLLMALIFAADRLLLFAGAILSGLRHFAAMNAISAGAAVVRLAGSLLLLETGRRLVAIALLNAVLAVLWAGAALQAVAVIEPRLQFRLRLFRWRLVRPHLNFGVMSLLTAIAMRLIWDMAPLVIGFFRGATAIVPYSVGRRFPIALNQLNSRAAETLFPAASERLAADDLPGTREVLRLGTRWVLVMALPSCLVLGIVAPNLLHAWLGVSMLDAALILRLTCAAVLAQALGLGAMQVLWGRGAVRAILLVLGVLALPSLALTVGLVDAFGAVGAAGALCLALAVSGGVFLLMGARACHFSLPELLRETFRGLLIPNAACTACTLALAQVLSPQHWLGVITCCLAGFSVYATVLYFSGAREEEKQFVREALRLNL